MNTSDITVYTCLVGDKDVLKKQTDHPNYVKFVNSYDRFKDDRRNSRIQKILAHQYISTEYSIYVDANIQLLTSPKKLIEKYLSDTDIAVFKHPTRDCVYEEAKTCAVRGLDDPEIIIKQAKTYEDAGYAKHKGLAECGIILRRHTPEVEKFNNYWWSEYCVHSRRDQISFMYAADKVGIPIKLDPEPFLSVGVNGVRPGLFKIIPHKHTK